MLDKKVSAFSVVAKKPRLTKAPPAVKPYSCNQPGCGKSFTQLGYLQAHLYTHAEGPLYRCKWMQCGRRFSDLGNLKKHMLTHTGERPYSCDWPGCGKSFSQVGNLNTHKHTHTGKRPYKCTICPKAYNQSTALKRHIRSHTGEKPFCCSHCDKKFSNSSHLKAHLRVHTGERPYQCDTCGKKFSQHSGLHGHIRTHARVEPLAAIHTNVSRIAMLNNAMTNIILYSYIMSLAVVGNIPLDSLDTTHHLAELTQQYAAASQLVESFTEAPESSMQITEVTNEVVMEEVVETAMVEG